MLAAWKAGDRCPGAGHAEYESAALGLHRWGLSGRDTNSDMSATRLRVHYGDERVTRGT